MVNTEPKYVEPTNYFSKEMRKAAGIGEYAKENTGKKEIKKATSKTKTNKMNGK